MSHILKTSLRSAKIYDFIQITNYLN